MDDLTPDQQAAADAEAAATAAAAAAAGDPPQDPPADPPQDPPAAPAPTPDPKFDAMDRKIDAQTELLNKLLSSTPTAPAEEPWTVAKLEEAETKCHNGEYDMKYLSKITTLKTLLLARQVATETTTELTRENTWADVRAKWDKGLTDARGAFGEAVADTNSKLFKTAQAILHQDPGFQRYTDLKAKGTKLSNIDPTLIDPSLQFKCFEIAASRLGIPRKDAAPNPNPPAKPGAKNALAGGTLPTNDSAKSELDRLEAKAVSSGEQADWIALDKARMRQQKEARR